MLVEHFRYDNNGVTLSTRSVRPSSTVGSGPRIGGICNKVSPPKTENLLYALRTPYVNRVQ